MSKIWLTIIFALVGAQSWRQANADDRGALSLVVMDPLAAPLACPCVEGYAQRKYEVLAEYLESAIGRGIEVTFSESLLTAMEKSGKKADIVIGKQSMVQADADSAKLPLTAISRLTDQQGSTDQFGIIVVNRDDPAESVADLAGYSIYFGPAEAAEKHSAAIELLKEAGITIADNKRKISPACSDGACEVVDLGPQSRTAAVISSYAQPLLEGCGTIKKGDLRVVAKTAPVPFVTLFIAKTLDRKDVESIHSALADVTSKPEVLEALESLIGFLPVEASATTIAKKK